jgi:hypothetical protein
MRPTKLAVGVLLLALSGCADKAAPDNVDRRSVERWNELIAHRAEKAYDYLSPGFRATQTRENYAAAMNNRPVQWKAATFKRKDCDAERCKVQIDVTYSVALPGAGQPSFAKSTQSETWILVDGNWYLLPK